MSKEIEIEIFRFIKNKSGIYIDGFITDPNPFKHKTCQNVKTSAVVYFCSERLLAFTFSGSVYKIFPTKQGYLHTKSDIIKFLKSNKEIIDNTRERAKEHYEEA